MCATTFGTLTLAGMLSDPLIKAVMRSDGVSEGDHTASQSANRRSNWSGKSRTSWADGTRGGGGGDTGPPWKLHALPGDGRDRGTPGVSRPNHAAKALHAFG
jgi:hypothetical protein